MRPTDEDSTIDHTFIDRIVDGGMTPDQLRAAISRLELVPDGWKRCAVAFLEGQVLGESFRALGQPQKDELGSLVPSSRMAEATRRPRLRLLRHAAAAGIVAASFAIGWFAHGTRPRMRAHDNVVRDSDTSPIQPPTVLVDSAGSSPSRDAPAQDRPDRSGDRDEQSPKTPTTSVRTVARFRFGPEGSRTEVPVLAGPGITQEWLTQQPPPVSEHGRAVLERQGYQVEQQRRYFTTILADGRRLAVPVDHVHIQYTGNEPL